MKMSQGDVAAETSPLLQAIRGKWPEWPTDDILHLIDDEPMAAQLRQANGRYPLHEACQHMYGDKVNVIMKLLEVFPQAAQFPDEEGYYPLHIACLHNCHYRNNEDAILRLIDIYPEAAAVQLPDTSGGCYPLHLACKKRHKGVIMKLLELFPEAAHYQDVERWYPLHIACHYGQSEDVLLKLIEIHPDAVAKKVIVDDYGMCNLLQLLAEYNDNANVVQYLLELPDLDVNATNNAGDSALHIAIDNKSFDIVDALLRHPFIMIDQRNYYNETPFDLADYKIDILLKRDDYDMEHLLKYQHVKRQLENHLPTIRWGSYEYFYQNVDDWSMNW